jgi:oxygen-independent coproporphyrinogen-3 oxidase
VSTRTELSADSVEVATEAAGFRTAYLHVPFCARLCPYCDFAVVTDRDNEIDRYFAALLTEVQAEQPWGPLDAIYFGGGTPSRVDPTYLRAAIKALVDIHGIASDAQVSLEANPEDWTPERAANLVDAGFNRVSFGAQSFSRPTLQRLGRRHAPSESGVAVEVARSAGFSSVNLDLIFGTPGDDCWAQTVQAAIDLAPDHVSCYALTVEAGTQLFREVAAGAPSPDPDLQADQWETADEMLTSAGLTRYEVSNWARPGHPVKYNLAVWARAEYFGFGLGAHRFRDQCRSYNYRRLDSYLSATESGASLIAGREVFSDWSAEVERVFLGIRRAAGVVAGAAGQALVKSVAGQQLIELGVVELVGNRLIVRKPLLTDAVSRALLDLPSDV